MLRALIITLILCSVFTGAKAQDALRLSDSALTFYTEGDLLNAEKVILLSVEKSKTEFLLAEDLVLLYIWKAKIQSEIDGERGIESYKEAERLCEKKLGTFHIYYPTILNNTAFIYQSIGEYEKAVSLYLKGLENLKQNFGTSHPDYGVNMIYLANLYKSMGNYTAALPAYLEGFELVKGTIAGNDPVYAILVNNLGLLYQDMGNYDEALPLFIHALEAAEISMGKNHPEYNTLLNNLALVYHDMGEYEKALSFYADALANCETVNGKSHPCYAERLVNMGGLYHSMGKYEQGLAAFLEGLRAEDIDANPDYDNILSSLALLYIDMGKYDESLAANLEAIAVCEENKGTGHPDYASRLNNLALLYHETGQYNKAVQVYRQSLDNKEKTIGKSHPDYTITLSNLAELHMDMGQYASAALLYTEIFETIDSLGQTDAKYSVYLNNLANLYRELNMYEDALPLYEEALEITKASKGDNHPEYLKNINNLALLYQDMGKMEQAKQLFIEVVEKSRKNTDENGISGLYQNNLAELYRAEGEYAKALALFQEAVSISEKSQGKNHPDYAIRQSNLGGLLLETNEYKKAIAAYFSSVEAFKHFMADNLLGVSEEYKASLIAKNSFVNEILQSLFVLYPDSFSNIRQAWENISFYKGLTLKSNNLLKEKLRESKDTGVIRVLEELAFYQDKINKEVLKPGYDRSADFAEYQQKAKNLENTLLARSGEYSELKKGLFGGYKELQARLKSDEAAIEFTHFSFFNKEWTDTVYYAAYIVKKDNPQPEFAVLFTEKELLDIFAVNASGSATINSNYLSRTLDLLDNNAASPQLYPLVWSKLEPYLKGIRTIYLSPSGYLGKVSFAALQDSAGRYVGEKYQLSYQLNLAGFQDEKNATVPASFLLAGGIDYTYTPADTLKFADTTGIAVTDFSGNRGTTMKYLPGTKEETDILHSLLKKSGRQVSLLSGRKANETDIKTALKNHPSVVHIATHGFYIPFRKNLSQNENKVNSYKASEDPMYRSGLILAGGNYAWEHGHNPYEEDDGILLAKEISFMNLSKTQLVVLSACETGLGDINGSEGVMGLQRALKTAGVRYQVTTLWPVPDKETVDFMEIFYSEWLKGASIEAAFITAQTTMMKKFPNSPFYWGAFVLYK